MMEQASLDRWNQNELAPTCDEGVVHDPQYTTSSAKQQNNCEPRAFISSIYWCYE